MVRHQTATLAREKSHEGSTPSPSSIRQGELFEANGMLTEEAFTQALKAIFGFL